MNKLLPLLLAAAMAMLAAGCASPKAGETAKAGEKPATAAVAGKAAEMQDPYISQREKQRAAREKSKARSLAQTRKMIAERLAAREKESANRKANAETSESDPERNPVTNKVQ
jgi:hypothetical protein